ncbi:MAG TPA: FG-GAP repeat protein [Candidatus Limnocylindria bacterium]|nr:FG-GAP repeat protein [Candidatus Limnocylindria bacterium]
MKSIQAHAPEEILKPRVITQGIEASLRFEIDQSIRPIAIGLLEDRLKSGVAAMGLKARIDANPEHPTVILLLATLHRLQGNTVVAGAPLLPVSGNSTGPGAAYVFRAHGGWMSEHEDAELTASDGSNGDDFGDSVSITSFGDTVVVGAPFHGATNPALGAVYAFALPLVGRRHKRKRSSRLRAMALRRTAASGGALQSAPIPPLSRRRDLPPLRQVRAVLSLCLHSDPSLPGAAMRAAPADRAGDTTLPALCRLGNFRLEF